MRTTGPKTEQHPITRKVMEQYEIVRISGLCNMFDYVGVQRAANDLELFDLVCLSQKEYVLILKDYERYMQLYNIKRQ